MTATLDTTATTSTWSIDPAHTGAEFAVKHLMISTVKGRFAGVTGTIVLDEANLAGSSVEVTIPTATVDTGVKQRDEHLRSADFFSAEEFPAMTFRSREVRVRGAGEFDVIGDLTIRGVTNEVTLHVTDEGRAVDPWGNSKAAFSASTTIDRTAFGLTWNAMLEAGGVTVSNQVRIQLDVQAVRSGE